MRNLLIIFFITPLFALAQEETDSDATEFGKRVFELIKGMDTISIETFTESFIGQEEMIRVIDRSDFNEEDKEVFRSIDQETNIKSYCENTYRNLKEKGASEGINWGQLVWDKNEFETSVEEGVRVLNGRIMFWQNDDRYAVNVKGLYVDDKYMLDALYELHAAGWRSLGSPPPQEDIIEFKEGEVVDDWFPHPDDSPIELEPDVKAEFPGGDAAMNSFVYSHIRYPEEAVYKKIQGRVYVEFVVEKDGSLTNIKIHRSADPLLDKEAMRMVRSMPRWSPARKYDKEVRFRYILPVNFTLAKD